MTKTKQTVMDIGMNLNRIGNWVADDYSKNRKKIEIFIANTDDYIAGIRDLNSKFSTTWSNFMKAYSKMKDNIHVNAENLMTWGNILTHRSRLLE